MLRRSRWVWVKNPPPHEKKLAEEPAICLGRVCPRAARECLPGRKLSASGREKPVVFLYSPTKKNNANPGLLLCAFTGEKSSERSQDPRSAASSSPRPPCRSGEKDEN